MPHISRDNASQVERVARHAQARYEQLDDVIVGFTSTFDEADGVVLSAGPADACHSRHWGYVLRGAVTIRYTDGTEERLHAGEAYVVPPGHVHLLLADTDVVEFTHAEEFLRGVDEPTRHVGVWS